MSERLYKGYTFYVTLMSLIIFPASNLAGISNLYIGWLGWVFLSYFLIGYLIFSIGFMKKALKWFEKWENKRG